jgi:serine protease inhibitor
VDGISRPKREHPRVASGDSFDQGSGKQPKQPLFYKFLATTCLVILVAVAAVVYINRTFLHSNKTVANKNIVISIGQQIVNSNNNLGFGLFKQVIAGSSGNSLLCPPGLSIGLSELGNLSSTESSGSTQGYQVLSAYLNSLSSKLTIANNLSVPSAVKLSTSNSNTIKKYAQTTLESSGAPLNLASLNSWLNIAGRGLLSPLRVSPDTANPFLLNTAVFSNPLWYYPFSKPALGNFYLLSGVISKADYLNQANTLPYYQSSNLQAVELPIGSNQDLSMYVFLPTDMSAFTSSFKQSYLNQITQQLAPIQIKLSLPMFSVIGGTNYGLLPGFNQTAMGVGFANLGRGQIYQEADLSIGSSGYYQASTNDATASVSMNVERTFVYLVMDKTTGLILFIGRVSNPS